MEPIIFADRTKVFADGHNNFCLAFKNFCRSYIDFEPIYFSFPQRIRWIMRLQSRILHGLRTLPLASAFLVPICEMYVEVANINQFFPIETDSWWSPWFCNFFCKEAIESTIGTHRRFFWMNALHSLWMLLCRCHSSPVLGGGLAPIDHIWTASLPFLPFFASRILRIISGPDTQKPSKRLVCVNRAGWLQTALLVCMLQSHNAYPQKKKVTTWQKFLNHAQNLLNRAQTVWGRWPQRGGTRPGMPRIQTTGGFFDRVWSIIMMIRKALPRNQKRQANSNYAWLSSQSRMNKHFLEGLKIFEKILLAKGLTVHLAPKVPHFFFWLR